ncbi:MAG TPA: hypothetical protein VFX21_14485 [Acidimicrobiia bacterium]|nr:hypothetical protein [Acidimicrobiia bacterium]
MSLRVDARNRRALDADDRPEVLFGDHAVPPRDRAATVRVVLAYIVIIAVMTFPTYPSRLSTFIPGDSGDALLNLWILNWAGHHVGGWHELWNTSIFYPHTNTLAYSESMLPVALAHRAIALVVRSDVAAFNLLYLAGQFLSAWCTYRLARRMHAGVAGAFLAGLVYTLSTPRFAHYQHFQLVFGWLVPLVVLLVVRYFESPTVRRGAALGAVSGVLALCASYYGLMTFVAVGIISVALLLWGSPLPRRRVIAGLAVAAGCAMLIVVPVARQYTLLQRDDHFRREPEAALAAHLADFTRVTPDNYLLAEYGPLASRSEPQDGTIENRLFPGSLALGLGLVGLGAIVRRRAAAFGNDPLAFRAFVGTGIAALTLLILSFGTRLEVAGHSLWMPYSLLRDVPGFSGIRATSRLAAFAMLALALCAAIGCGVLVRGRSTLVRGAVVTALTALLLAESATSIVFTRVPDAGAARAVNEALADRPPGPVAELPVGSPADGAAWGYIETPRQWLSRIDGDPRVSGYSGFDPPGFDAVASVLDTFPSEEAFTVLQSLGVRYVVIRTALPGPLRGFQEDYVALDGVGFIAPERARGVIETVRNDPRVRRVDHYGDAWLIELK